jgi:hypothetical protein
LHGEEVDAAGFFHRINGDDIGVIELRQDLGLATKTREPVGIVGHLGGKHLESYVAAKFCVSGAMHLAHAAGAKRRSDIIRSEF